jgi:hypothetical protein
MVNLMEEEKPKTDELPLTGKARSHANLRPPWKPGEAGNPQKKNMGRPKPLTRLLREILERERKNGKTEALELVEKTLLLAKRGNSTALTQVWERSDGKVAEEKYLENWHLQLNFNDLADMMLSYKAGQAEQVTDIQATPEPESIE